MFRKNNDGYLSVIFIFLLLISTPDYIFGQRQTIVEDGIRIEEVWISMADGTQLAADLYMLADLTENQRLPVFLEYLPYRKDEDRGGRFPLFSSFMKEGYIVARVDIRGTGRSQGKLVDGEYSEQEQMDGEKVIDWLSKQSFSTGKIAMFGISWGGFNSLHLAMRHPPALKTIRPTLQIGNTNSRYRFPIGAKEFMNQWSKQGPAHHCSIGVGHIADKLEKLGQILNIDVVKIC